MASFCSSENDEDSSTSQWITAFVSRLFTFCPPGPLERAKVMRNSDSGIGGMIGILTGYHLPRHLRPRDRLL